MPGVADIVSLGAAPDRAKVLCVFVHGRGQSPEEMEAAVIRRLTLCDVAFALPRAEGKSWYAARAVDPLTDATREDLAMSLDGLARAISGLRAHAPGLPLLLAGFSQGACLSLEHVCTGKELPDAVVALTGCRVGLSGDDRPASLPSGLPVYLSAGDADPWIPVQAFAEAAAELGRAGARLRCDVFPGRPHEVSDAEIAMLETVLIDLAAGRSPAMGAAR
ncbi:alpha/beta hydrolase [Tabrizicola sp. YIM 78059]|uniref:alpha/beta hydrolase n=1 Tax=Tabrizicola sp. YIM 78059 TaxID=2529861 RepID=UPI0010AB4AD0|nr:phospholipase [Tabrizicola sp. YIM 78059]